MFPHNKIAPIIKHKDPIVGIINVSVFINDPKNGIFLSGKNIAVYPNRTAPPAKNNFNPK
ncbi:hypothetical protein GUU_02107 [Malacoplasma iowae 695]|nr:hypothetical protein GUU_02107 [Malacoplasma iowae 695]